MLADRWETAAPPARGVAAQVLVALVLLALAPGRAGAEAPLPRVTPTPRPSAAPRATPSLELQLAHARDPLLRESAALVLGDGGGAAALPLLIGCLRNDDNRWVRAACAEALGALGDPLGVAPLTAAIQREKHPRVRRAVARALLRLGQRSGLEELMWQLQTAAQHDKAEAMHVLVHGFGRALAQTPAPWWEFFAQQGYQALAARATGSTRLRELPGLAASGRARLGPFLFGPLPERWREVCATVLRIDPGTRLALDPAALLALERRQGSPPRGCLLLVSTGWLQAPVPRAVPSPAPASPAPGTARNAPPGTVAPRPARRAGPGLTAEAARLLLQRWPTILGIGIDAPRLDAPSAADEPALALLRGAQKLVITSLDGLRELPQQRVRVLLLPGEQTGADERRVLVLALPP